MGATQGLRETLQTSHSCWRHSCIPRHSACVLLVSDRREPKLWDATYWGRPSLLWGTSSGALFTEGSFTQTPGKGFLHW